MQFTAFDSETLIKMGLWSAGIWVAAIVLMVAIPRVRRRVR